MRIIPTKLKKRARDAIQIVAPELLSNTEATLHALGWTQGSDAFGVFWRNPSRSDGEWSAPRAIEIEGAYAAKAYLERAGWECRDMTFRIIEARDPLKRDWCKWSVAVQRERARVKERSGVTLDR